MPIYEYYCSDCRGKFEVLTTYEKSREQTVCAACHGVHVRKLLSVVAKPARGGDAGDFGDSGGDDFGDSGGGCCGGACGCHN
ncbi:MAG: hypothetical protein OJF49_003863 [Ktedonobacterales bacterium]|nr:MAG: hypothetical protein OJF49_003863 [Ktedonobacterales bacterium]